MKTRTRWMALTLLLLVLPETTLAQEQNRFLAIPVAELARTWLLRNCGIAEEPLLEAAVIRRAEELTPVFTRAWENGPPEALLAEARDSALKRFERNRAALEGEGLGLSVDDARRARARTADDFVGRALESLEIGYRSQALRGLYLGGSETGRQLVQQLAGRKDDSVYGATARVLLNRER